ncbi:MAG: oxygen-independent coproporphyrinogen III oxidase-like protein [Gammaproteobacteria bacterium]|nr:oxygen-independent coproporphyrinogen III oxidase-like protein [Gammaproteobacteria bacterium]
MFHFTSLPPLSLYVHIPWCVRKCPYCDFNSHARKVDSGIPEIAYVDALIADLELELPLIWGRKVQTIFVGGGTPSLFSPEALDRLLCGLRARLAFPSTTEITLEANPGTIESGKFHEFRAVGINRLSIGVQSFDDALLQRIGRIHGRREAIRAAEEAHHAGFDNFNLDLMFGLPAQTVAMARKDLDTAIALSPSHLSHYQLTLEPNTQFHAQPPQLPEDDLLWEMQDQCHARLEEAGYGHYEISAFAKPDRQCRHNLNYWQFGDYLGIGAGAHGKISDARSQSIQRSWKLKHPDQYLAAAATEARLGGSNLLTPRDAAFEFMLNALRLIEGVPSHLFQDHTGLPLNIAQETLHKAESKGLIEWDAHRIRPTLQGQRFLNDLLQMFLPEDT